MCSIERSLIRIELVLCHVHSTGVREKPQWSQKAVACLFPSNAGRGPITVIASPPKLKLHPRFKSLTAPDVGEGEPSFTVNSSSDR
jgi:hypothetical protein